MDIRRMKAQCVHVYIWEIQTISHTVYSISIFFFPPLFLHWVIKRWNWNWDRISVWKKKNCYHSYFLEIEMEELIIIEVMISLLYLWKAINALGLVWVIWYFKRILPLLFPLPWIKTIEVYIIFDEFYTLLIQ